MRHSVVLVAALMFGCSDVDAPTGGSGGSGNVDGGSGGNAGATGGAGAEGGTGGTTARCGGANTCVVDPGEDWAGPFALIDSATGCEGEFPNEAVTLFDELQTGDASCSCACGDATVACSKKMAVVGFASTNCANPQGQSSTSENACYNTVSASHSLNLPSSTTTCDGGTVAATIPTPTWSRSVSACNGFNPRGGLCDAGQTCVPIPASGFETGLCYTQAGDHSCPADFSNKALLYASFSDTRACATSCDCRASGGTCRVSVTGYASANCVSPQGATPVFSGQDECVAIDSDVVKSIRPGAVSVSRPGICAPQLVVPTGAAAEEAPTTVCCS